MTKLWAKFILWNNNICTKHFIPITWPDTYLPSFKAICPLCSLDKRHYKQEKLNKAIQKLKS